MKCQHYIVFKPENFHELTDDMFLDCHRHEPRHSVHEHRLSQSLLGQDEFIRWHTGSPNDRGPE